MIVSIRVGRSYLSNGKVRTDKKWYTHGCNNASPEGLKGIIRYAYHDTWYFLPYKHQMPGYNQDKYECNSGYGWQVRHPVDVVSDIDKTFTFTIIRWKEQK